MERRSGKLQVLNWIAGGELRVYPVLGILGLEKIRFIEDIKSVFRGASVTQSVKHPTLDFGSGHDFMVHGIESCVGLCIDNVEPAWDSLSFPLSLCLPAPQDKETNI